MKLTTTVMTTIGTIISLTSATAYAGSPNSGDLLSTAQPSVAYETTVSGYYLASGRGITVDADGNAYVFARTIGDENQNNILIFKLDPSGNMLWSYYINGDSHDVAGGIILNGNGEVYITGWTDSENFPVTDNAMDKTLTGFRDAFLFMLSTADGSLVYSTLIGGDYTDEGYGIALNPAGEIYLVGSTKSMDFPTVNAYQDSPNYPTYAYYDIFIMKLNAAGNQILYSTYFGGTKSDFATGIELDGNGDIIIAGSTDATDFPLANPIISEPVGMFISELSPAGDSLLFSTYFGGSESERLNGITVDSEGYIYMTGSTQSTDFPTTPGAYQEEFVGEVNGCEIPFGGTYNCDDVFLSKLSTDGSIIYSTYLGGSTIDVARDVAVDNQGRAYVVGYTYSQDFPPDGINFSADIFLSRFDATGNTLDYSVTVESGSANAGHGVAVDASGNVYFTGAIDVPADVYVSKILGDTGSNEAPFVPQAPTGITNGTPDTPYEFTSMTDDPDGDAVMYMFDWDDGPRTEWMGPYSSGDTVMAAHSWTAGEFNVAVKAKDQYGMESDWSEYLTVDIGGFLCGDANGSAGVDIDDAVFLVDFIFTGGAAPDPFESGNLDCTGDIDIDDVVYLLNYIFTGGTSPCDTNGDGVPDC